MFDGGTTPLTFQVGAAIAQYVFVTFDGTVVAAAADGADADGITLEAVTAAEFTNGKRAVAVLPLEGGGVAPVRAAASTAIAAGNLVASAANGEAKVAAAGDAILGKAMDAAGSDADQEIIRVLISKAPRLQV